MSFIKKNKKAFIVLVVIVVILIVVITLSIIKRNEKIKNNVDEIFSVIGEKNYIDLTISDRIDQYDLGRLVENSYNSSYFKEVAIKKINEYIEANKPINLMNIMVLLGKYEVYDDEIQNIFSNYLKNLKYDSLEENELAEFIADYSSLNVYRTSGLDSAIINTIKNNCDKLIMEDGKGGYYDSLKEKYKSTSKRVDPLGRNDTSYDVGTYTESIIYEYLGDILVKKYQKRWYGTSSYDSNNSDSTTYYFKEKPLISYVEIDYYNRDKILNILKYSENYVLGNYIISINGKNINVLGTKVLSYNGSLEYR